MSKNKGGREVRKPKQAAAPKPSKQTPLAAMTNPSANKSRGSA
jgi:hypothetical protein